jgi:hypothetical protein
MFASKNIAFIVSQTSRILNNPVVLINYSSHLLASCCDQPIDDPDLQYLLEHGRMSPEHLNDARGWDLIETILNSSAPVVVEPGRHMTHRRISGIIRANQKAQAMITVPEYNRKLSVADSSIIGAVCGILSALLAHGPERAPVVDDRLGPVCCPKRARSASLKHQLACFHDSGGIVRD